MASRFSAARPLPAHPGSAATAAPPEGSVPVMPLLPTDGPEAQTALTDVLSQRP